MKKLVLLLAVICFGTSFAKAQAPFWTDRYNDFYNGYPIVTILFQNYFANWSVDHTDKKFTSAPLKLGDVIVAVNGKDALTENGMDEFFDTPHITMTVYRFPYGSFNVTFDNLLYNPTNHVGDLNTAYYIPTHFTECPGLSVVKAQDIDFTNYGTYDFLIESNDPLIDEEILTFFVKNGYFLSRMRRDTENPDVIFCVAKSADESISATYVPPTTETVTTGSVTQPVYNYITRSTSYVTRNRNQTVTTPGHTEMTTLSNIYLEIVALDAKKLNDPNQKTPPEIWKMTYTAQNINDNRTLLEKYIEPLGFLTYPFHPEFTPIAGVAFTTGADLIMSEDRKTLLVGSVAPNSNAEKLGLQTGDRILKINGKDKFKVEAYTDRWPVGEAEVLLGDLDIFDYCNEFNHYPELCLFMHVHMQYELKMNPKLPDYKGTRVKALAKDVNEFLIERNGKKIKLKGQLWDPHFFDMKKGEFFRWAHAHRQFFIRQHDCGRSHSKLIERK